MCLPLDSLLCPLDDDPTYDRDGEREKLYEVHFCPPLITSPWGKSGTGWGPSGSHRKASHMIGKSKEPQNLRVSLNCRACGMLGMTCGRSTIRLEQKSLW